MAFWSPRKRKAHNVSERQAKFEALVGWGVKEAGNSFERSFELAPKTVNRYTTANSQRKRVPDSWSGYSKTRRTKTYLLTYC